MRAHDLVYDNEIRLIAEQKHDIYRVAGIADTCFKVPSDLRQQVEIDATIVGVTTQGVQTAIITATGATIAGAGKRIFGMLAAIAGWSGWEVACQTYGFPLPSTTKFSVDSGRAFASPASQMLTKSATCSTAPVSTSPKF